ncbi:MAG: NADH-flavin reductase-like protein [Tardiphaga sp.]|jgi:nucleoside-diphosphate-sugar epimerase|nr:NADH-flavin reductase-like protein [Tardiphaga sp.]
MTKIIVLGASGALGKHVAQQAVDAGQRFRWRCAHLGGHDVAINSAGSVSDGDRFVTLVAHIVNGLEIIDPANRPVAWFVAGAGLGRQCE